MAAILAACRKGLAALAGQFFSFLAQTGTANAKFHIAVLGLDIWAGRVITIHLSSGEHIAWETLSLFNLVITRDIQLDEATATLKEVLW